MKKNVEVTMFLKKAVNSDSSKQSPLQKKMKRLEQGRMITQDIVNKLDIQGMGLYEIASALAVPTVTVSIYLERLARKGKIEDISRYVSVEKQKEIEDTFKLLQSSNIKKVKDYLRDNSSIEEIRIVRGNLQYKERQNLF